DALSVLHGIGAIDEDGRATDEGRELARIPTDPRLARALRDGAPLVGARLAAEVVALIGGEIRIEGGDIAPALVALRDRRTPDSRRWTQEVSRLLRSATFANTERAGGSTDDVGLVVALAFPERIARRVDTSAHGATFL